MAALTAFLKSPWLGAPVGVWIAIGIFLVLDAIVAWGKWTRAQGLLQAIARVPLSVPMLGAALLKFPLVGWALRYLAGPEPLRAESPAKTEPRPLRQEEYQAMAEELRRAREELAELRAEVEKRNPPAPPPPIAAGVALVIGALGMALAMACTTTNAYRVIDSAASLSRSACDLLFQIDSQEQRKIGAEKATIGEEAAAAKVTAWRAKVDVGYKALKTFSTAVVTAEATLNLIVAGQEKKITIAMVVAEVAKAVTQVRKVLEEFGVKVPLLSIERARERDVIAAIADMREAREVVVGDAGAVKLAFIGGAP
jgi:hypothetical protein